MKQFLKFTLASIAGFAIVSLLFLFIGISVLFAMASKSETVVKENSVFVLDLSGVIEERTQDNPFSVLWEDAYAVSGLNDILSAIDKANANDDIKGIYLNVGVTVCSTATLQEIRAALSRFKESGKFIIAYCGAYVPQSAYYVASVADRLILNPSGSIAWHGLATQRVFYKELLDKLGVNMQIFRVGTYKSAVEPYMSNEMSEANREQTRAYLQSIWGQMTAAVAADRHISMEKLNELAGMNMDLRPAGSYIENGMADTLMYKDEVLAYLKEAAGAAPDDKLNTLTLADMNNLPRVPSTSKNVIAVYYAYGEIDGGSSVMDGGIYSEKVAKELRKLREDKAVKAVVLRVNSPGGSAYGSEQIWREVAQLRVQKPVVVSMGDYAASGGYYISCAADRIVAEPATLTGSIGIFGVIPDMSELATKKIGLHFDGVKTHDMSDMNSGMRPLSKDEKIIIQNMVNDGYELFVRRCAEGRNMSADEIKRIAEGRVWTGEMAQKLNLVDELGGIDVALSLAARLAEVENDYRVSEYPVPTDFFSLLMEMPDRYIRNRMQSTFGLYYNGLERIKYLKTLDRIQARIPYDLIVE